MMTMIWFKTLLTDIISSSHLEREDEKHVDE